MTATDKIKAIYVIKFPDGHFVSKDTLAYGEEVIEHLSLTKDISDSYSFTNLNNSLYCEILYVAKKINPNARLEKVLFNLKTISKTNSDDLAIIEYAADLYLKNNVAVHIHYDDPIIKLELTPNINEAYQYNPLDQKICRDYYSTLFSRAKFYSVEHELN